MAGEDFFLKFGSNADEFARNVQEDVAQARRQISLLTDAVRELDAATRSSSAASNLISGIRDDLKGMSGQLARDLGRELRTALTRELSNLNINVGATVDPNARPSGERGGSRSAALDTPEADRLTAQAQRQTKQAARQTETMSRETQAMVQQALKTVDGLEDAYRVMGRAQQEMLGRVLTTIRSTASRISALDAEAQSVSRPRRAAGEQGDVIGGAARRAGEELGSAVDGTAREVDELRGTLQRLQTFLTSVVRAPGRLTQENLQHALGAQAAAPEPRGPASATAREEARRVEVDPSVVQGMIDAGAQQAQAAEEFRTSVGKFDSQIDRFAAAISNMQVSFAPGELDAVTAQQRATAQQVAEVAATAPRPEAQAAPQQRFPSADEIKERLGTAVAQVQQLHKRFPDRDREAMAASPQGQKLREALGSDEAVDRALGELVNETGGAKNSIRSVRESMEELRIASEAAQASTREVANTNAQVAAARREEASTAGSVVEATEALGRSERSAARARDAEARAAESAARDTGAGTTAEANRAVERATRRRQALQAVLTGDQLGGSYGVDEVALPREQRAEATQQARAQRAAEGLPTLDRQALFDQAFEQLVPSNIEGEARNRLRGIFLDTGEEAVAEARKFLNRVSSRGVPPVSQGAVSAAFAETLAGASADVTDPAFQRQRRRSRALEMLPVLDQGPGSIEAATRGGPLATLNERLRQVGFQGEVASRGEGAEVLGRLRTDLNEIVRGMTGRDREDFRRLQEMPEDERAATAQRMRTAAESLTQAGRLIQAAIRTGAIQPPTGLSRAADVLEREPGTLRTPEEMLRAERERARRPGTELETGGDEVRRQMAEAADVVRLAEAREMVEASAVAQQFQAAGASLEEVENLVTDTARQGRVKRMALDALDAADNAILNRYQDIVPEERSPQVQAAMQRAEQRSMRAVEDRLLMERKMEMAAARGEGAQERTERVSRGGLESLARRVELPREAVGDLGPALAGRRLQRATVPQEQALAETLGRNELTGQLVSFFNESIDKAVDLNRQRLLRGEAESALSVAEGARRAGLPVDEREVAAAERIMAKTTDVNRDLQNVLQQLYVPGQVPGEATQQVLGGRALADFIRGADRGGLAAEEGPDLREEGVVRARQSALEAEERRLQLSREGLSVQERLAQVAQADPRSAEVVRGAGQAAARRFDEEQALAASALRTRKFFDESAQALESAAGQFLRGPDPEAARRFAEERQGPIAEAERRAAPFLGREHDVRAVARGVATPEQLSSFVDALGGMEQVVDRVARSMGATTSDMDPEGALKPSLRDAPEDLIKDQERLARREAEIAEQRTRVQEAELVRDTTINDEEARAARIGLEREQNQLRSLEGAREQQIRQIGRTQALVAEREAALQRVRERNAASQEIRGRARQEVESVMSGQGGEIAEADLRRTATEIAEGEMPQSIAQLQAQLRNLARAGGVSPEEAEGVTSAEQLVARIGELSANVDENSAAVRGNTTAEQQNTGATQQNTAAEGGAAAGGARGRTAVPTIPLPGTDEGMLELRSYLTGQAQKAPLSGLRQSLESVFSGAERLKGLAPDEAAQGQVARVRNMLARLAGGTFEAEYGKEAQATTTGRSRIDQRLIDAAQAGVQQTLAAIGQRGGLEQAETAVAENQVNARLISVLGSLESSISQLIVCCKAMQGMVRGGGGGGTAESRRLATQQAQGPQIARMVTGELSQRVTEAIGRSEAARGAGDTPGARRALSEAAMEIMADPGIGRALEPGQVVAGVQELADTLNQQAQATGADPRRISDEDKAAIRAEVDSARLLQRGAGGQEAFEAFRKGDVEGTAKALVQATGDVEGAHRELVAVFKLDSEAAKAARVSMEALQQSLVETGQSAQQRKAREDAEAQAERTRETERGRLIREDIGTRLSDRFDINAPIAENAPLVAEDIARRQPDATLKQVMSTLDSAYGTLDEATAKEVANKVRLVQATERASREEAELAAARQRAATISDLLPPAERARFQESIGAGARGMQPTITAQEITDRIDRQTGGQVKAGVGPRRAVQGLLDTGEMSAQGAAAFDQYAEGVRASMTQYRTPMQQMLGEIWGGGGFMRSVVRTAGNFVSRYIGGALVFGLAAQLRELTSQALEAEQTFIRITGALDATGRSAEGVRAALQDIAVETNTSVADTYEVMAQLVGVFETTDEALEATKVIGQLELISQGALSAREGFRALSAVVSTFQETLVEERGLSQTQAITYVADLATRIQDLTGVNIEDTTEGLARLGETANSLGIEMELIASAIGQTAKASGQTGSAASEQIGRILANFQKNQTQNLLVQMGITDKATVQAGNFNQVLTDLFTNYEDLSKADQREVANLIGDPRQFALTNALLSNGVETLDTYHASLNSAGAAADRAEKVLGTMRGQLGQLGKTLQAVVENLVDLGILNVFGALAMGAQAFLTVINEILQAVNALKSENPLLDKIFGLASAIAGFKLLTMLVNGAIAGAARMSGMAGVTGAGGALAHVRNAWMGGRGRGSQPPPPPMPRMTASTPGSGMYVLPDGTVSMQPPSMLPHPPASELARKSRMRDDSPIWQAGRRLGRGAADRLNLDIGEQVKRAQSGMGRMRNGISTLGNQARQAAPSIMAGALALGFLYDLIARRSREAKEYFESQFPEVPQRPDETDEEHAERQRQERAQSIAREQAEGSGIKGRFDTLSAVVGQNFDVLGQMLSGNFREAAEDAAGFVDNLSGGISEGDQAGLDQYRDAILSIRDSAKYDEESLDALKEGRTQLQARLGELIANANTPSEAAAIAAQGETLMNLTQGIIDNVSAEIQGLSDVSNFTSDEIDALVTAISNTSSLSLSAQGRYAEQLSAVLDASNLPDEARAAIDAAMGSTNYGQRLQAEAAAVDLAIREAQRELVDAEGIDAINEARERLESLIGTRAEYDQRMIDALADVPLQFADIAARTGDYAGAERALRQAIEGARQQRMAADSGSSEEAAAIEAELDALKRMAEISIAREVGELELMNIGLQDPLEVAGNELRIARTRLEAAMANPGAFSPEEIRQMMTDIASAEQTIADEQRRITDALTQFRITAARNPLTAANMEYAAALGEYNRAISEDLGTAAIIEAATGVEEAAQAQRQAMEDLRVATSETRISLLPQGDTVRTSMAELAEAFEAQAFAIREFGRDSAEYQSSITAVEEARRAVQSAIDEVFDATTELAIALARAAGLDIEVARMELDAALAEVDRAMREAGGNESAAAVQTAMARATDAAAGVRDTILGEAMDMLDFQLEMEDITEQQAIAALESLLNTVDLTEDQRRDIMRKIKSLEDSVNEGIGGQFNLGEIRIPTPYEVRRAIGLDQVVEVVNAQMEVLGDSFKGLETLYKPDDLDAEGGSTDEVFGAELWAQLQGLGDLLPPISEIPRLVDETIATRDATVSRLESQLDGLSALRDAQNSSIGMLGAVVAPPLELIQADTARANELSALSQELMAAGNEHLLESKEILSSMNVNLATSLDFLEEMGVAMRAWLEAETRKEAEAQARRDRAHDEAQYAPAGPGSSYGLDPHTGRPDPAYAANVQDSVERDSVTGPGTGGGRTISSATHSTTTNQTNHVTNNIKVDGGDIEQVKRVVYEAVGAPAQQRTSPTGGGRRM